MFVPYQKKKFLIDGSDGATLLNFSIVDPIDIKPSLEAFESNRKLYFEILSRFEVMALNGSSDKFIECVDNKDWHKIQSVTNELRSKCEIVGAGKLYYACYYMHKAYDDKRHIDML